MEGFPPIERVPFFIPFFMFGIDEEFRPILVSLGPYHRNNPKFQIPTIVKAKADATDLILNKHTMHAEDLKGIMSEVSNNIRVSCYGSRISKEEFFFLMLKDSCFMIRVLACIRDNFNFKLDLPFGIMGSSVIRYLILLENQILFRFVKDLYGILAGNENEAIALAIYFVETLLYKYSNSVNFNNKPIQFEHLLHLIQLYLKPNSAKINHDTNDRFRNENYISYWRSAKEYYDDGVTFRKKKGENHSILDLEFRNGVLIIPFLKLDDFMCTLLKNLIVLRTQNPVKDM